MKRSKQSQPQNFDIKSVIRLTEPSEAEVKKLLPLIEKITQTFLLSNKGVNNIHQLISAIWCGVSAFVSTLLNYGDYNQGERAALLSAQSIPSSVKYANISVKSIRNPKDKIIRKIENAASFLKNSVLNGFNDEEDLPEDSKKSIGDDIIESVKYFSALPKLLDPEIHGSGIIKNDDDDDDENFNLNTSWLKDTSSIDDLSGGFFEYSWVPEVESALGTIGSTGLAVGKELVGATVKGALPGIIYWLGKKAIDYFSPPPQDYTFYGTYVPPTHTTSDAFGSVGNMEELRQKYVERQKAKSDEYFKNLAENTSFMGNQTMFDQTAYEQMLKDATEEGQESSKFITPNVSDVKLDNDDRSPLQKAISWVVGDGDAFSKSLRLQLAAAGLTYGLPLLKKITWDPYMAFRRSFKESYKKDPDPTHHYFPAKVYHDIVKWNDKTWKPVYKYFNKDKNKKAIEEALTALGKTGTAAIQDYIDFEAREDHFQNQLKNYKTREENRKNALKMENTQLFKRYAEARRVYDETNTQEEALKTIKAISDDLDRQKGLKIGELQNKVLDAQTTAKSIKSLSRTVSALQQTFSDVEKTLKSKNQKNQIPEGTQEMLKKGQTFFNTANHLTDEAAEWGAKYDAYKKEMKELKAKPADSLTDADRRRMRELGRDDGLISTALKNSQTFLKEADKSLLDYQKFISHAHEVNQDATEKSVGVLKEIFSQSNVGTIADSIADLFAYSKEKGARLDRQKLEQADYEMRKQAGLYQTGQHIWGVTPFFEPKYVAEESGWEPIRPLNHYATPNIARALTHDIPLSIAQIEAKYDARKKAREAKHKVEPMDYSALAPLSQATTSIQPVSAGPTRSVATTKPVRTTVLPLIQNGMKKPKIAPTPIKIKSLAKPKVNIRTSYKPKRAFFGNPTKRRRI